MSQSKVDYVKAQGQTRYHLCHWPGCFRQVPPAKWGCTGHWFSLPASIRGKIWRSYRAGQEIDMKPSQSYIEAAKEAQDWIKKNCPKHASN